jgi:opacity protein-like surface antigen
MQFRLALPALLAGMMLAVPSDDLRAQGGSQFGLGAALGANVPTADYGDAAKVGLVVNGFLNLRLTTSLGARGELFWSRSDIDNPLIDQVGSVDLGEFASVSGNVDLIGASADLVYAVGLDVQPYVIGGVGVFRRRVSQSVTGTVEEFKDLTQSDTDVGWNAGVGVRFHALGLTPFIEARFYSVATSPDRTNFVPVTVGVSF